MFDTLLVFITCHFGALWHFLYWHLVYEFFFFSTLTTHIGHDRVCLKIFVYRDELERSPTEAPFNEIFPDRQKVGKISVKYRVKFNGMETESPCEQFLNGNLVQTSFKIIQNILV